MNEDKKVGMNEQDAPHKEGQYGNTSANPNAEENISMGISQMKEEGQDNNRNQSAQTQPPDNEGRQ